MGKRGRTDGESTRANSRAKWVVCSPDSAPYGLTKPYTARQHKHTYTQHAYTQARTACIHTQITKHSSTQTIEFRHKQSNFNTIEFTQRMHIHTCTHTYTELRLRGMHSLKDFFFLNIPFDIFLICNMVPIYII